jgi:GNAT superfamily N-acetyltransferase
MAANSVNVSSKMLTRSLLPSERELYRAHLLRLSQEDRFTRFCCSLSDTAINHHVDNIDFGKEHIKVAFDDRLNVIAAAHLCAVSDEIAEFSLSIETPFRNKGYGRELFKSSIAWMKATGVKKAYCSCLRSNGPMLHIALSEGMQVHFDESQADAYLALDKAGLGEIFSEMMEEQFAWLDFTAKYLISPNKIKFFFEKYKLAS